MSAALTQLADIDLSRLVFTLALVAVAIVISRWQRLQLEGQMFVAVVRAFVQLIAVGYVLELVFEAEHPYFILLAVAGMTAVASWTSGGRARGVPHARLVALASISTGVVLTLGLLVGLGVFTFTARNMIPIAGMVVGNSMTACSLVMARVHDEITTHRNSVEAALALGATSRQAALVHLRRALITGMTPIVDSTKTVGLISLPGAMTGMILAGSSPLQAVQLQIIVMYMLIGAAAYTSFVAAFLTSQQHFTALHQLKLERVAD